MTEWKFCEAIRGDSYTPTLEHMDVPVFELDIVLCRTDRALRFKDSGENLCVVDLVIFDVPESSKGLPVPGILRGKEVPKWNM